MAETFGERLRRLRTDRGLSPGALAMQVGVTEGAIRQMESGQTKSASFPVGVKLAVALGVEAAYLATGDGAVTPRGSSAPDLGQMVLRLEAATEDNRRLASLALENQKQAATDVQSQLADLARRLSAVERRGRRAG